MSLERFHRAQAHPRGGFSSALEEISRGQKSSHWIWYVFPQIDGLGRSAMAREFALRGAGEALEYLGDSVLGPRYLQIVQAVHRQLDGGVPLEVLMGSDIDALKLVSSLTLFRAVAQRMAAGERHLAAGELEREAEAVLQLAGAQGYSPCRFTLTRLAEG